MPIKPENLSRYPKDWKAIRAEVLERAGNKCEQCAAPNYWIRNNRTDEVTDDGFVSEAWELADGDSITKIVLTIAHLDHTPENNGEPGNRPNLRAWCQRCHLAYDAEHHRKNSFITRRNRIGVNDLFEDIN